MDGNFHKAYESLDEMDQFFIKQLITLLHGKHVEDLKVCDGVLKQAKRIEELEFQVRVLREAG